MKCLIDFGNSRCKWRHGDGNTWSDVNTYIYPTDQPVQHIEAMLAMFALVQPCEVHVVSVLGESFDNKFKQSVYQLLSIDCLFYFSHVEKFGVTLSYKEPLSYGADRYAAIIAAHHSCRSAKIVIDSGTATTIDVVDRNGVHQGGLIIPGAKLMCSLLANNTAKISLPDLQNSVQLLNTNTQDAVVSGSVLSLRYGIRAIVDDIEREIKDDVTVFVSGGESELLQLSTMKCANRPNLVLEGLQIMLD